MIWGRAGRVLGQYLFLQTSGIWRLEEDSQSSRGRFSSSVGEKPFPTTSSASGIWRLPEVAGAISFSYPGDFFNTSGWPAAPVVTAEIGFNNLRDATATGTASFSGTITSDYPVSSEWERSVDGGVTWSVMTGETGLSITLAGLTMANDGDMYRIVAVTPFKRVASASDSVRYDSVSSIQWSQHPLNAIVYAGNYTIGDAIFTANAYATGDRYGASYTNLPRQWQVSTNGGSTWTNVAGATGASFRLYQQPTLAMNGYQYRARGSFGALLGYSNPATLTVL